MEINIIQMDRIPSTGGVITARAKVSKSDGKYKALTYAAQAFTPDPESPDFVPFDELTEADVIGWFEAKEGWAEDLEARLDADIERQKNPPVLSGLPWAEVEAEA